MMRTGRPRQFDRDEAVIGAMHLFWEKGYDATSLAQLKASIGKGITAPSFYAAFGSKEALFNEAVSCYLKTHAQVTEPLWDPALPPDRRWRRHCSTQPGCSMAPVIPAAAWLRSA